MTTSATAPRPCSRRSTCSTAPSSANACRHRHREFLRFLKTIDQRTLPNLDLHLVVDNYATHKTPAVKRWLKAHITVSRPPLPLALHTDLGVLAQHGRALLRRDYPQSHPPRRLHQCRRTERRHHGIPRKPQCR